jgi:ceramide glucosyltransferase
MSNALIYSAIILFLMSVGYFALAIFSVRAFRTSMRAAPNGEFQPPVSILKPICGMEAELVNNLRSFCEQDYDDYQIVFGVRDASDPAIAVIEQIKSEFPDRDITLVINDRLFGTNYKIGNLVNIAEQARHDIYVISDSDMWVEPDYLLRIVEPFAGEDIGATTCLYVGEPAGGLASRLGVMFVNDWFLPSALIPARFTEQDFCFGATMAVRRNIVERFGGFQALANFLADDYMLGKFVVREGYKIALVPCVVKNIILEESLKDLFLHETRWARTIKSVQPLGYSLALITEILPLSLFASAGLWALTSSLAWAAAPVLAALALRTSLHLYVGTRFGLSGACSPWLIPLRDMLTFMVRVGSYFGSKVSWRNSNFIVKKDNRIEVARKPRQKVKIANEKSSVSQPADL